MRDSEKIGDSMLKSTTLRFDTGSTAQRWRSRALFALLRGRGDVR